MTVGRGYTLESVQTQKDCIDSEKLPTPDTDPNPDPVLEEFLSEESELPTVEIDFQVLLEEVKSLSAETYNLTDIEIDAYLYLDDNPEEAERIFPEVVKRLEEETRFMDQLLEYGTLQELLEVDGENEVTRGSAVSSVEWKPEEKGGKRKGFFRHSDKKVFVYDEQPTALLLLFELSNTGQLPPRMTTLIHELAHGRQHDKNFQIDRPVREAHSNRVAYLLSNQFRSKSSLMTKGSTGVSGDIARKVTQMTMGRRLMRPIHILASHLLNLAEESGTERIVASLDCMDKMYAMGFSHREVLETIAKHGDYVEGEYTELRVQINKKMQEKGFNEADVDLLLLAYRMETEIDRLKVQVIVNEEMIKVYKEKHGTEERYVPEYVRDL